MGFGKKAKQVKTQYETEGQQLGREAYTNMQPTLDRIGNLAMNPDEYRQRQLNTYYNSDNSAKWSDAQRMTRRTLADATANNYNATHGGYSSAGSKYYDDVIRKMNDYNARLWDTGVGTVNNMLTQDTNLARNYYNDLWKTHDLAQAPDAIDEYNKQIDQYNKQRWTEPVAQLGTAIESFAPGWFKLIGTGMKAGAYAGSTDYSNNLARLAGQFDGDNDPSQYRTSASNIGSLLGSSLKGFSNWGGLQGSSYQGGGKLGQKISQAVYGNKATQDKDGLIHFVQNGIKMVYDPNDPNKPAIREE